MFSLGLPGCTQACGYQSCSPLQISDNATSVPSYAQDKVSGETGSVRLLFFRKRRDGRRAPTSETMDGGETDAGDTMRDSGRVVGDDSETRE